MKSKQIIQNIKNEIENLEKTNTPLLRQISKKYYYMIKDKTTNEIFSLCNELLEMKSWSYQIIAYEWAFRLKKYYTIETYTMFETWLYHYINDWYDCDDFCCHAFGHLIYMFPELASKVLDWTNHENFAVRRAASVIFIYSIRKGKSMGNIPFEIVKKLMHDDHYLVLKGNGWLLKEMSKHFKNDMIKFLQQYEDELPRITFRYAIEKLSTEEKKEYFK